MNAATEIWQNIPVIAGAVLISLTCSLVGTFNFLRKQSLLGDVVSHSILPGICLSFLLSQTKDSGILLLGGAITGFISVYLTQWLQKFKLKPDTINALVLSVFFGIGIVLLTMIQKSGNASQSGLNNFLFGKAVAIGDKDVRNFLVILALVGLMIAWNFRALKAYIFDPGFAAVIGIKARRLDFLLSVLTVLAVASGISTIGVVLVSALLVTPVLAARFWTHRFEVMILLAALFSIIASLAGTMVSASFSNMPTGPWIVVFLTIIALLSFALGAKKGFMVISNKKKTR